MPGRLMGIPAPRIPVEFEDEEQRRIGRRTIGQEQFYAGFSHSRFGHHIEDGGYSVLVAGFGLDRDRHDEAVIEIGGCAGRHDWQHATACHSTLWSMPNHAGRHSPWPSSVPARRDKRKNHWKIWKPTTR